jgi:hypothetical protein
MNWKTGRFAFALSTLVLVAFAAQPLRASISAIAIDGRAHLSTDTTAVVTGTILCSMGDTLDIGVSITQTRGKSSIIGNGNVSGIACTGAPQSFAVPVDALLPLNASYNKGPAFGIVSAFTSDGMGNFDDRTESLSLHISN